MRSALTYILKLVLILVDDVWLSTDSIPPKHIHLECKTKIDDMVWSDSEPNSRLNKQHISQR